MPVRRGRGVCVPVAVDVRRAGADAASPRSSDLTSNVGPTRVYAIGTEPSSMRLSLDPKDVLERLSTTKDGFVQHDHTAIAAMSEITRDKVYSLLANEKDLLTVQPRFFEELVAELLSADGWQHVTLVKRLNAHGPDIIAYLGDLRSESLIVECKRWNNSVGVDVVRTVMYWVVQEFQATRGMVATTSRFTRDAIELRERKHRWQLDLRDAERIVEWMSASLPKLREPALPRMSVLPMSSRVEDLLLGTYPHQGSRAYVATCDPPCQRCGGDVVCGGADTSANTLDYYADFFHVCLSCRWSEEASTHESNLGGGPNSDGYTYCPLCTHDLYQLL